MKQLFLQNTDFSIGSSRPPYPMIKFFCDHNLTRHLETIVKAEMQSTLS